jgi:hypothetical protein
MYATKSSRSAKDFLYRLKYVVEAPILNVQTDNGSEFYHQFETALQDLTGDEYSSLVLSAQDTQGQPDG